MRVTFRPVPDWPYERTDPYLRRSRSTFKALWSSTLDLLEREIRMLGGANAVIGAGFTEHDIRIDGMPRADARAPRHPGIEISFDSRHGRLVYATDVCDYWQHNVRSIALGLESLRAVDRYGISRKGEQYAGWRELPAGATELSHAMSVEEAKSLIDSYGGVKEALFATHPDRGGDPDTFARVQRARDLVKEVRT